MGQLLTQVFLGTLIICVRWTAMGVLLGDGSFWRGQRAMKTLGPRG
jgi:hypothetical protein